MGKLMYGIIFVTVIQIALIMFTGQNTTLMSIVDYVINFYNSTNNAFVQATAIALAGGTIAVVAGLYLVRNEWILYATMAVTFLTFGTTIVNLWQFIASQQVLDATGGSADLIATLICGGLAIMFLFFVLDFSRGKD